MRETRNTYKILRGATNKHNVSKWKTELINGAIIWILVKYGKAGCVS
jgi:hypothetical protein